MWWGTQRLWVGITLLCVCALAPAQGIRLSVQQVWSGLNSTQWNPYYANIENQGSNENGVISTSNDEQSTTIEYPVELPTGTKKRVLFLMGGWNDGKIYLRTSSGIKEATVKSSYSSEQTRIGLISDNPSDLIFLKGQPSSGDGNNNSIGIGGCIPEDAPDRFMGYDCLDAVVLADGTERLRDEQIRAIKQYVRSGGVVLFVGGAAPSASNDPRWRDILPVSNTSVVTRNGLTERIGAMVKDAKSVEVSKGSVAVRAFGVGLASMMSVNPFESPMRESEDRRSIVNKAIQRNHHQQIQNMIFAQIGQDNEDYYGGYSSVPPVRAVPVSSGTAVPTTPAKGMGTRVFAEKTDPFEIKPPSVSNIMWILIAYAIIVVPVNFLVLRKANKLEWAWITTPIISILFSGILLNSTIGLYKASATTKTASIAVLEAGTDESLIFGKSEMFFPRARGDNDLGLVGVETILRDRGYRRSGASGVNLTDNGRNILGDHVNTGNLAFKDISYAQSSEELKGLKITLESTNGNRVVRIQNQSHSKITGLTLYGPGSEKGWPKEIQSGASVDVIVDDIIKSKPPANKDQGNNVTWQTIAGTVPNHIVVFASLDSMHAGPKYGEGHPSSQYLFVTAPQWGGRS